MKPVPSLLAVFVLLSLAGSAGAELTLPDLPETAKRCSIIKITPSTDEGHEWAEIQVSGLKWRSGYHHHWGYDQSATPGPSCFSTAYEWSMAWRGPPTWEYEVVGAEGTKATVEVTYIGGAYGQPVRTTGVKEIRISGSAPKADIEDLELGHEVPGNLLLDANDNTTIRVSVTECGVGVKDTKVTFTTDYGILGQSPVKWDRYDVKYRDYEKYREEKGATYTRYTDESGFAEVVLTAHTPVIGNRSCSSGREGDILLWNDPGGNRHGQTRIATVTAEVELPDGMETLTVTVPMNPCTDIPRVLSLYWAYIRNHGYEGIGLSRFAAPGAEEFDPYLWDSWAVLEGMVHHATAGTNPEYMGGVLQRMTLYFLNRQREWPQSASLVDGWDWAPVKTDVIGHKAVVLYKRGSEWRDGYILDPWWSPEAEVYTLDGEAKPMWPGVHFGLNLELDEDAEHADQYPALTSSLYENLYPWGKPPSRAPLPGDVSGLLTLVTKSPVVPLVTDEKGRRSGMLADGTVVTEIPDTTRFHLAFENASPKYQVQAVAPEGTLSFRGTEDGTFSAILVRTGSENQGAEWADVPVTQGEVLTVELRKDTVFVPLLRANGEEVWPVGSESFRDVDGKLEVKGEGKDAAKIRAVWSNGDAGIDAGTEDLEVHLGERVFLVPAGEARVSKSGKVAYKAHLPDGSALMLKYKAKKGKLTLVAKKLDLSDVEEGETVVGCRCGNRGGTTSIELEQRKKKFVTLRE